MSNHGSSGTGQHLRALREERRHLLRNQRPEHYCLDCHSVTFEDEEYCLNCATPRPSKGWTALAQANDPWLGRIIKDRYLIARSLGQGSSGQVYRAESLSISRQFAVKIIATDQNDAQAEQIITRLNREIEALSRLRNPHICSFYEIFDLRGQYVAAIMDLIEGTTLEELILDSEPLDINRACSLLRQTANGIFEAHQAGMIHRDLKPENLMVERLPAGDDFVHILDFGIVRLTDDSTVNLTHGFIGTPLYASPEQATGKAIDHRSDIYSLGAILFFMLTGEPPFFSNNVYEVLRMHVRKEAPRLSDVDSSRTYPESLEELTRRMLAKQPDDRPHDLSKVIDELDRFSRNQFSDAFMEPGSTDDRGTKNSASQFHTPASGVVQAPANQSRLGPQESDSKGFGRDEHTSSATLQAHGAREPAHTPAFLRKPTPTDTDNGLQPLKGEIKFETTGEESSAATAVPTAPYRLQSHPSKVVAAHCRDGVFAVFDRGNDEIRHFRSDRTTPLVIPVSSPQTVETIALSTSYLLTGHDQGTITQIGLDDRREEALFQDVRRAPISALATDDQGRCIVAGSRSGRIYLHQRHRSTSSKWKRIRGGEPVRSVVLNQSAENVAIARQDNTVEILNLTNPRSPIARFSVNAPVRAMSISPDDYLLAAALVDRTVGLFQIPTGRKLLSLEAEHIDVLAVNFSDDGRPVAVCSIDRQIRVLQFDQIGSYASTK